MLPTKRSGNSNRIWIDMTALGDQQPTSAENGGAKVGKAFASMINGSYAGTVLLMFVMWMITIGLQAMGYQFIKEDHTLILGALILALKVHSGIDKPPDTK